MVFSSIIFIAYFLPVFLIFYYVSGMRTAALLTGSVVFYVWGEGNYILLLGGMIAANYLAGLRIAAGGRAAKRWLVASIILNVGVLAVFKYADFLLGNLSSALGARWPALGLTLPLSISFFTFQLISYSVDVYRGTVETERRPIAFATYILMFPHLIAGPIVRYASIRDELDRHHRHLRVGMGVQYFIVGLCQKVLIANTLAPVADLAFGMPGAGLNASTAWLGILAYTLQIYFDFCGYSNMAIGLAFLLGFTFPKNFDYPYAARSVTHFWRRWHMSLSSWFRDYVYIPLGGNRGSRSRTMFNLLATFLLTGLWHGAAWNFIGWGLFHGGFLLLERAGLGERLARANAVLATGYTLLVVMVGWVLFRADDIGHATHYLQSMAGMRALGSLPDDVRAAVTPEVIAAIALGCIFALPTWPKLMDALRACPQARSVQIADARHDTLHVHDVPVVLLLSGFVLACALLVGNSLNPFLYFRF